MLYFEKNCGIIHFRSFTLVFKNTSKLMCIAPPITKKRPIKKLEILAPAFYFQNKNSGHLQFSITQIFRLMFIIFEYLTYIGQLLLKLRAVELAILVHLITTDSWQQLNSRQRKRAVNFLIVFFERYYQ